VVLGGAVHLFSLDSYCANPDGTTQDSKQALWLKARLAASKAPWKLVSGQRPAVLLTAAQPHQSPGPAPRSACPRSMPVPRAVPSAASNQVAAERR
jgi:phosphodiesterase/alkaline phosphatase D-like protein